MAMVGHILNDSVHPTTFFSLQVELVGNHPPFGSNLSKTIGGIPLVGMAKHDRKWWTGVSY